jgi:hypothetical protein
MYLFHSSRNLRSTPVLGRMGGHTLHPHPYPLLSGQFLEVVLCLYARAY